MDLPVVGATDAYGTVRPTVVGGGVALVAGLWAVTLSGGRPLAWAAGAALVLVGVAALADGIRRELDVGR